MSLASIRPLVGAIWVGPALVVLAGCSGGTPTDAAPQAASPAVPADTQVVEATPPATPPSPPVAIARPATPDRYAVGATTPAPSPKPAIDFDAESFRTAAANGAVVGDRYSR